MIGVKLQVPEYRWVNAKTGKQLRSTRLWDCTIIDAKLATAGDADPCFVFECDDQTDEDAPPRGCCSNVGLSSASTRDCYGADRLTRNEGSKSIARPSLCQLHIILEQKMRLFLAALHFLPPPPLFQHTSIINAHRSYFIPLPFVTAASPTSAYLLHHCRLRAG
jgi:hypothetical protein